MDQDDSTTRARNGAIRRGALCAALCVFAASGYIRNSRPGWNVNSQFALTCAIVERGTVSIDAYHAEKATETGDKAFHAGRFYCDKSPTTSFLGVPALALYRTATVWGLSLDMHYGWARWFATWTTIGGAAAICAAILTILLARAGVEPATAATFAALWIAATPLLGYSVLFFNYMPACAFALGGWALLDSELRAEGEARTEAHVGPRTGRLFAAGVLFGLASWTLQTVALFALAATGALAVAVAGRVFDRTSARRADLHQTSARRADLRRRAIGGVLAWCVGGAVGASGYAIYGLAVFGEIASPYKFEYDPHFREEMARGLMGATWPKPIVLHLLTFHPFRGLFVLFPATFLATLGAALLAARGARPERTAARVALATFAGLLIYNSAYYMWWGGWTYAPRHLIPALPLLGLGLAPFARARGAAIRIFAIVALAAGALVNLAVVGLDPQPPPGLPDWLLMEPQAVWQWGSPFATVLRYAWAGQGDPNLGRDLGIPGVWSHLPLVALWVAALGGLALRERRARR